MYTWLVFFFQPIWKIYDRQNGLESSHRRSWKLVSEIPLGTPGFVDFEASLMCLVRRWSSRLVTPSYQFYMRKKPPEKQGSWWITNPNHSRILKGNPLDLPYKWPVWNHQNHIGKMPSRQAKFPPKPEPVGCFVVVASRFGWLRKKQFI